MGRVERCGKSHRQSRRKRMKPHTYWKKKYEYLCATIQMMHERAERLKALDDKNFPQICISASKVFWISNDLEVFDNEESAKEYAGKNNYFKVKKTNR